MLAYVNGRLVPEEDAVVSVFDRSFLYGDGLFETFRVHRGRPFRWPQHWRRLEQGAAFLKLTLPWSETELLAAALELIERNQLVESILRITVSRGVGVRGYSIHGADAPLVTMTMHPLVAIPGGAPPVWRLHTASIRVPAGDRLAQFKTCNKLPQILARAEAEAAGCDEAILLNTSGYVAEAASSNLFWFEGDALCTSPVEAGLLAGVTRGVVLELAGNLGWLVREESVPITSLVSAGGVFLSLSTLGVVEASAIDGQE
ncbi:MAG: aminotransferase class IV, partial [Akkermansiaceae bacterium]|nr:aminotransferase class IV [Verrucomicrobiales bacterium]